MEVSIILPAHNEEQAIKDVLLELNAVFSEIRDKEIIVVDDASVDNTFLICKELAKEIPNLDIIKLKKNLGKTGALYKGFKKAKGDTIAFMDSDGQYFAEDLLLMVEKIKNLDLISGYRKNRNDSFYRIIFSRVFNFINRVLFKIPLHDCNCGMKVFKKEILNKIKINSSGFFFDTELLAKLVKNNMRIYETEIRHKPRKRGKSSLNVLKTTVETLKYYFNLIKELK